MGVDLISLHPKATDLPHFELMENAEKPAVGGRVVVILVDPETKRVKGIAGAIRGVGPDTLEHDADLTPEMTGAPVPARDRNHIQVQRVDEWLKRYRAAGSPQPTEVIAEGSKIIDRNLKEIRLKADAPKSADFSWFHRQSYDAQVAWRKRLTDKDK